MLEREREDWRMEEEKEKRSLVSEEMRWMVNGYLCVVSFRVSWWGFLVGGMERERETKR